MKETPTRHLSTDAESNRMLDGVVGTTEAKERGRDIFLFPFIQKRRRVVLTRQSKDLHN